MIPSLTLESGYGAGRCRSHEPHIRRDGDELETLLCHERGVLGRAREDPRDETVLACRGKYPVDSVDHLRLAAVRSGSIPEALPQVGGSYEDGVQSRYSQNLLQVIQGLLSLDHGHRHDG